MTQRHECRHDPRPCVICPARTQGRHRKDLVAEVAVGDDPCVLRTGVRHIPLLDRWEPLERLPDEFPRHGPIPRQEKLLDFILCREVERFHNHPPHVVHPEPLVPVLLTGGVSLRVGAMDVADEHIDAARESKASLE